MKISVEAYYDGKKLSHTLNNNKPEIKNPTVLSIIDHAIERTNRLSSLFSENTSNIAPVKHHEH